MGKLREVREQHGGIDHRPVLLTMSTYISCESTLPRWNYKQTDCALYSQLTDQVTKHIRVEGRDTNTVVKYFNAGILTAAQKYIPRVARQNYKPYCSEELERLDEELSAARREAETNPSQDNHSHLQHTKPDFSGTSFKPVGKAGETKQHHSIWRKMVPSCRDWQSNLTMKVTAEPQQHWKQMDSTYQANKLQTNLLTIMKK